MKFLRLLDQVISYDPIPTESTILTLLRSEENIRSSDFTIVDFNWASYINSYGIAKTQVMVDSHLDRLTSSTIAVFICQHIMVESICWGRSVVFTPHCTENSRTMPIAHYACKYTSPHSLLSNRKTLCSFMGSGDTHVCRREISNYLDLVPNSVFINTGSWYYDEPDEELSQRYSALLGDSVISLCPRGTGPSTIRIWEALASGSSPLIISDSLSLPYPFNNKIPSIETNELARLRTIVEYIQGLDKKVLDVLQKELVYEYRQYAANNTLHRPILDFIREN